MTRILTRRMVSTDLTVDAQQRVTFVTEKLIVLRRMAFTFAEVLWSLLDANYFVLFKKSAQVLVVFFVASVT